MTNPSEQQGGSVPPADAQDQLAAGDGGQAYKPPSYAAPDYQAPGFEAPPFAPAYQAPGFEAPGFTPADQGPGGGDPAPPPGWTPAANTPGLPPLDLTGPPAALGPVTVTAGPQARTPTTVPGAPAASGGDSPIYEKMRAAAERQLPGYQDLMNRYLPPEAQGPPPGQAATGSRTATRPAAPRTRPARPSSRPARPASGAKRPPSRPARPPSRPGAKPSTRSDGRARSSAGSRAIALVISGVLAVVVVPAVRGVSHLFSGHQSAGTSQSGFEVVPAAPASSPASTATSPAPSASSQPSGSSQPSASPPARARHHRPKPHGPLGAAFRISTLQGGGTMTIQLAELLDPAPPESYLDDPGHGKHLVGAVFAVHGLSGIAKDDADNDAILISTDGKQYAPAFALIAGHTDFTNTAFRLTPGASAIGTVTFVIPDGVRIATVKWASSSGYGPTVTWHLRPPG